MREFVYCVNGTFVPASQAALALNDLGLVRGYGVFDVLRTYGQAPFHLRAHLERLQGSAAQIDLPLPWSLAELTAMVERTLAQNDATDVTVRLVATAGASPGFMLPAGEPTLLILVAPVKPYAATCYTQGSSLITVNLPRFMPSVKSLNYISAVRGQQRARAQGAVEALYCTAAGELSECTTSNLFAFFGDQLVTPNVDVLAGITRGVALELAADLFEVVERPLHYGELVHADEVFITSTTKEIMPIVRVDDIVINSGNPGQRTLRLLELFHRYVQRLTASTSTSPAAA